MDPPFDLVGHGVLVTGGVAGFHTPLEQMSLDGLRRVQRVKVEGAARTSRCGTSKGAVTALVRALWQ